jgi:hypothetical protein
MDGSARQNIASHLNRLKSVVGQAEMDISLLPGLNVRQFGVHLTPVATTMNILR